MNKKYNITILWGTDGFGKWLCEYILKEFSEYVRITITGRNQWKWKKITQELLEKYLQPSSLEKRGDSEVSFSLDNVQAVQDADIVIYSVPIAYTQNIIEETLPYIKAWAVVADVTSIKKFPSKTMQTRDDIIVIPTHPMFGPYIQSIAGQAFVLTPEQSIQETKEYKFLYNYLKNQKARVIESTPEYHDKMMAVVQGLTHLNMFVVGETMKRLGFNIADSMDFISPIYKLMISSVGRYLWQNPALYADIQMYNDEVLEVHEKFLDTAKNFHRSVQNKDSEKFCQDIMQARDFLGVEHCQEGQEYTDKVIYLLGKQLEILKNKLGEEIVLVNIYTREQISGKLLDFSQKEICLDDEKKYNINTWEVL